MEKTVNLSLRDVGDLIFRITQRYLFRKNEDLGLDVTLQASSLQETMIFLRTHKLTPSQAVLKQLEDVGIGPINTVTSFYDLLRRPDVKYTVLCQSFSLPEIPLELCQQVEISIKYEGYMKRQLKQVEQFKKMEHKKIPESLDYNNIQSLRKEARQKLIMHKPVSVGQASRISGVSPADISVLLIYIESMKKSDER